MILVAGGYSSESGYFRSVEVYNPRTGYSCVLSPFPSNRQGTVASGLKVCGGAEYSRNCVEFSLELEGSWNISNTLQQNNGGSSGWDSPQGLVLIRGGFGSDRAEMLIGDHSQYIFNITTPRM